MKKQVFYVKRAGGGWTQIQSSSKKAAIKKAEKRYRRYKYEIAITYSEYLEHGLKYFESPSSKES